MTIWKYPLEIYESQSIAMPEGAEILAVQLQDGNPCLWALVDPSRPTGPVLVQAVRTGRAFDPMGEYIGTCVMFDGELALHVFASRPRP